MIGSCPDIEFTVVKLAQQIANLLNEYYQTEFHLCKYLLNTCKYWIIYNRLSNESVVVHFDSDWVQDPESYQFMTGYFNLIAHKVIS